MHPRRVIGVAVVAAVLAALAVSNIREVPLTNSAVRIVEQRGPLSDAERANTEIFERVSPSVVQVAAQSAGNPFREGGASSGTGFVWDNDGHVVTNNHVVQQASAVAIRDTAINPGNSGGPLLDSAGRLIGVTTAILSASGSNSGIGFAIPVDIVNRVVPELISKGRVPTPGIGIVAANEAVATRLGTEGLIVMRTAPGSPAESAGIRGVDLTSGSLGDVITAADGKPVHRLSDLIDEIEQIGPAKSVRISLKRGSETRDVMVDIVDRDVTVDIVDIGRTQ